MFMYSEKAKMEDIKMRSQGESVNQRMARVCVDAMNDINPDLKFTTETQEDFCHERLPTLDFEMWVGEDNKISHSYFQKSMRTPMVIMEKSGISRHQKFQILTNELSRRLSNIQIEKIEKQEIIEKIEQFTSELKNSGYAWKQAKEMVSSGIMCWKTKIQKRRAQNIPFYRLAESTIDQRLKKQLTERESWYKDDEYKEHEQQQGGVFQRQTGTKTSSWKRKKTTKTTTGEKKQVKTVIFVPHTTNSGLANELREKEARLEEITGEKIKIVEKGGRKLENILTSKNPWKGLDCKRPNCFLCMTKVLTGKDLRKDCTKRNILYEIRCLSCEEEMKEKILDEYTGEDAKETENRIKNMKSPVYIGESSRSAYERGYEHLDKLTSLSNKSHLLRHIVQDHQHRDVGEIKWGMFIIEYKRTAFERQISEAVLIKETASKKKILNSKSEWNQCALPSLVTKLGNRETELKEIERELREEKMLDDELDSRIRTLRKNKNKERLKGETETTRKRQKIDSTTYVSVRDKWGPPPPTAPEETITTENTEERNRKRTEQPQNRTRVGETITNIRRIPDRVIEGETLHNVTMETIDWDAHIREHRERIERETDERMKRLEKQAIKEKSWILYRECKEYLETNEKSWEKNRLEREIEQKKRERLAEARQKQENIKRKVQERKLRENIENRLGELPIRERQRIQIEDKRQRDKEIQETKKSLWKLRGKEKKYERKTEKTEQLERISTMEEKLILIEETIEKIKEEEKKQTEEKKRLDEKLLKEWRKKVRDKEKKEIEKQNRLRKQETASQRWSMLRWITNFISENSDRWEEIQEEKELIACQELYEWDKKKRLEKIDKIKQEMREKKEDVVTVTGESGENKEDKELIDTLEKTEKNWNTWRVPPSKKRKIEEGFDTTKINLEHSEKIQKLDINYEMNYSASSIIKEPKLDITIINPDSDVYQYSSTVTTASGDILPTNIVDQIPSLEHRDTTNSTAQNTGCADPAVGGDTSPTSLNDQDIPETKSIQHSSITKSKENKMQKEADEQIQQNLTSNINVVLRPPKPDDNPKKKITTNKEISAKKSVKTSAKTSVKTSAKTNNSQTITSMFKKLERKNTPENRAKLAKSEGVPLKQTGTGSTGVETTTTLCSEKVDLPADQQINNNLVENLDQMRPNQGLKIADQVSSRSELEKDSTYTIENVCSSFE